MVAYGQDPCQRLSLWIDTKSVLSLMPISLVLLTGCGGGGGGGGSSLVNPPSVQAPPPINRIGASEVGNSPGLHLVLLRQSTSLTVVSALT